MIPALPADQVRAAIAADDWELAGALLREHDAAVAAACAAPDFVHAPREALEALLDAQRALADEIRAARDETLRLLEKLGQDQRGARAWQKALA